jgi:hypothetical protein
MRRSRWHSILTTQYALLQVHNMPWELLQSMNKTLLEEFPAKIQIAEITPETSKAITRCTAGA